MRFFLTLFTLYSISHIYIFYSLRRAFPLGRWQIPLAVFLTVVACSWLLIFGKTLKPAPLLFLQDLFFIWTGLFVFFLLFFLLADITAFLAWLGRKTFAPDSVLLHWLRPAHLIPWALACAVCAFGYSLYEAQQPKVATMPVYSEKIAPEHSPLRVVFVSDIHTGRFIGPWMQRRMASAIAALKPDILLVGGDFVDTDMRSRMEEALLWKAIPAPLGKFAVTGNHEAYRGVEQSVAFMEAGGFEVLRGREIETGGIAVAGVDDDRFRFADMEPARESIPAATLLPPEPDGKFRILLQHQPRAVAAALGRFDLQLSGHTHGGQIRPGNMITERLYGIRQGLNIRSGPHGTSKIYVSNGLGFWGPPIRFLAPPEITLFLLAPPQEDSAR